MENFPTKKHLRFSFESTGVDLGEVIRKANRALNIEPQIYGASKFYDEDWDYEDYGLSPEDSRIFILDHFTTQGVVLGKAEKGDIEVIIPSLSSEADIAYAFSLLRALGELYPDLIIRKDDVIPDFTSKGADAAWEHCRTNMRDYLTYDVDEEEDDYYYWDFDIRGYQHGTYLTIGMLKKQNSISDDDVDIEKLVDIAFAELCRLQWITMVLPHAPHSLMSAKYAISYYEEDGSYEEEGDEENVVIITNDNLYVNASWSEVVLCIDGKYKAVDSSDFYDAAIQNDNIEVFTSGQYAISKMTPQEWANFCQSIPGILLDPPKTFILRWNPAISDFSRKRYNHCLNEYGQDWGVTWTLWDWQQAQKGDRCFMLLEGEGEEPAGIIFTGKFECNPFPDLDWRGTGKECRYVDVVCRDIADINKQAWLTPEQLEAAIPDFNWRSGHSGELLTAAQAEVLEKLWNRVRPKI